jgi:hypothetical protein
MTALQLQLGHVLSGLTVRARKPKRQRLVDHLAAGRIAHPRERRLPRLRYSADHPFKRYARMSAADAHHRNRCRRPAGGEGEDSVVRTHAAGSSQS